MTGRHIGFAFVVLTIAVSSLLGCEKKAPPPPATISGTVDVAPELAKDVTPNYVLFVTVRAADAPPFGPPIAAHRMTDLTFPVQYTVTQKDVFFEGVVLEGKVNVYAKLDKDGHPLGIVHRDVSMKNVMIAFEGDVKLTDFGIAKARGFLVDQEGEIVAGKADYMSPEQADFKVTDKRSDIFSAGVVLGHLLLGKNIFKAATAEESRQRIMNAPIPDFRTLDSRIDDRLNDILHRCLARELGQRYQTADELMVALEYYIYGAGYGPTNETLGKFIRELYGQAVPAAATGPHGATEVIPRPTTAQLRH